MKKVFDRVLSFTLALVMAVSLLLAGIPAPVAYAEPAESNTLKVTLSCTTERSDYAVSVTGTEQVPTITVVPDQESSGYQVAGEPGNWTLIATEKDLTSVTVEADGLTFKFGEGGAAIPGNGANTPLTANITDTKAASEIKLVVGDTTGISLSPTRADHVTGGNIVLESNDGSVVVEGEKVTANAAADGVKVTAKLQGTSVPATTYATVEYTVSAKEKTAGIITVDESEHAEQGRKYQPGKVVKFTFKDGYGLDEDFCKKALNLTGDPSVKFEAVSPLDGNPVTEATLTCTFNTEGVCSYTVDGGTVTFEIDNTPPTVNFTVTEQGDQITATVSNPSETLKEVHIVSAETNSTSAWEEAVSESDGKYEKSFSKANVKNKYIHYQATDLAGNPASGYLQILPTATIADFTSAGVKDPESDTYYYNAGNASELKIPVTFDDTVSSLPGDAAIKIGEESYSIKSEGSSYYISFDGAEAQIIAPISGASLVYSNGTAKATLLATGKTTNTYVLDTQGPKVSIKATATVADGNNPSVYVTDGYIVFPDSLRDERAITLTLTATVTDDNKLSTSNSVPSGWSGANGTYTKSETVTNGGSSTISFAGFADLKDLAGNVAGSDLTLIGSQEGNSVTVSSSGSVNAIRTSKVADAKITINSSPATGSIYKDSIEYQVEFTNNDLITKEPTIEAVYNDDKATVPAGQIKVDWNNGSWQNGIASDTATVTVTLNGEEKIDSDDLQLKVTINQTIEEVKGKEGLNIPAYSKYSDKASVDGKAPKVTVTWAKVSAPGTPVDAPTDTATYYEPLIATITVTDLHFVEDSVTIDAQGDASQAIAKGSWTEVESDPTSHSIAYTFSKDGNYYLAISAKDGAEHPYKTVDGKETLRYPSDVPEERFIVDGTAPVITVEWNNLPGGETAPTAGKYYANDPSNPISVKVTIVEEHFDKEKANITIGGCVLSLKEGDTWQQSTENPHEYTYTFTLPDGKYDNGQVSATDLAGHTGKSLNTPAEAIWIDSIDPEVTITWKDTTPASGEIYDTELTAILTVTETNLNTKDIKVTVEGEWPSEKSDDGWSISEWTEEPEGSGVWKAEVTFGEGSYKSLTVDVTDLAKRPGSAHFNDPFIVDVTKPVVTVTLAGDAIDSIFTNEIYSEEDHPGLYFVQITPPVGSGNGVPEEVSLTLTITVTDNNLAVDTAVAGHDANSHILCEIDGKPVPASASNDNSITFEKTVTVKRDEALSLSYSLDGADLAGHGLSDAEITCSCKDKDITFSPSLDGDTVSNSFAIDRRRPTSGSDVTPPEIMIAPQGTPANSSLSLYAEDAVFTVTVTDGSLEDGVNAGLKDVEVSSNKGTLDGGFSGSDPLSRSATLTVGPGEAEEINGVTVTVLATDRVGNTIRKQTTVSVDKLAPRIEVSFDNNNVFNGKYYQAARTATITVTDLNFDPANTFLYTQEGAQPAGTGWTYNSDKGCYVGTSASWSRNGDTYTATVAFGDSNGQDYTLQVESTDLTGVNTTTVDGIAAFVIDEKNPVLTVTFDNNDVRNGHYYNAERTATVTINETNFGNGQGVVYQLTSNGAQPQLAWAGGGDIHTARLSFPTDGDYSFTINYTDLAGRQVVAQYDSGLFTVDLTSPTVEISNIENYSANRGRVAPVVTFDDTNFDANGYDVTVTKIVDLTRNETVQLANTVDENETGVVISFSDLAETLENDGIYTIVATITDLAGNASEATVTYSVNRKGSTYYAYDDPTIALLEKVYSNQAPTLRIAEINPDTLTEHSVTISVNNSNTILTEGSDYTVEESGGPDSFKQYIYTINSEAFMRNGALAEGSYTIVLDSTDTAGNINSNRANEISLPISFTLDATAPNVSLIGVAEGDRIRAEALPVTVSFEDGYALAKVEILLNGEVIKTLEGEELAQANGEYSFDVAQSTHVQNIQIRADDAAGNQAETEPVSFRVINNWFLYYLPWIIGISAAGLLLLATIIILVRRHKKENDANPAPVNGR